MYGAPRTDYVQRNTYDHPANVNTLARKTLTPSATETFVLDWVHWGYDRLLATAEYLVITIGGATVWRIDIPASVAGVPDPPHEISFPGGLCGNQGDVVVVWLSAASGAGAAKGKVNVGYH